jgi:amino acid transporter
VVIVVVVLGAVAAWGILESVVIAGLLTLVEVGGLLAIVVAAAHSNLPVAQALTTLPPLEFHVLFSIAFASLLAFFAFIGFEDLANIVEEAKNPHRDIPRAMVFTLIISTALYVIVAAVAISAVSVERLSSSPAPLSLVFREIAGVSPATISAIAIVATLNTILAQITMAARVVYGMARQGDLPATIGAVHPGTATPWLATALIVAAVVGLALAFPFVGLAGKHIRCDACGVCGGQSGAAAAQIPSRAVIRSACEHSGLDAGCRACFVRRHDCRGPERLTPSAEPCARSNPGAVGSLVCKAPENS